MRTSWLGGGLAALTAIVATAMPAEAGRVPMRRTEGMRAHGARPDVSVPYLNNGDNGFGAYAVGPRIYSSPILNDPAHPQARPVFNLPFYGGVQAFGTLSNGAAPRPSPR